MNFTPLASRLTIDINPTEQKQELLKYEEKASKIISEMEKIVVQAQKKVDDHKYNQIVGKLKTFL